MICQNCLTKLDEIDNFRQLCLEAEKMLHDFRATLRSTVGDGEGKVNAFSYSIVISKMMLSFARTIVAGLCQGVAVADVGN